jgi:hypothetical protein
MQKSPDENTMPAVFEEGFNLASESAQQLEKWFSVGVDERDDAWETGFLRALPAASVKVLSPEPHEGPDNWPYLLVETDPSGDEILANILGWLSTRGIGLVLNANKPTPDYVFTYGMIWNFREQGVFLSSLPERSVTAVPTGMATGASASSAPGDVSQKPKTGRFELKDGQQVFAGPPTEAFLPKYVRSVIKQFFLDQGVFAPKILMLSLDRENFDLCFSIESLKSPPAEEHAGIAEALAWFLPAHYSVSLVSEKTVPGFLPL